MAIAKNEFKNWRRPDYGIYLILNILNHKSYIGSSNCVYDRLNRHERELRFGIHHSIKLQRAYDKYGPDKFEYWKIENHENGDNLLVREQHYLDTIKPEYNIELVAGRPPILTPEQREAISLRMSGKNHPFWGQKRPEHAKMLTGEANPFYGKHHSQETIESNALKHCEFSAEDVPKIKELISLGHCSVDICKKLEISKSTLYRLTNNKLCVFKEEVFDLVQLEENNWLASKQRSKAKHLVASDKIIEIQNFRNDGLTYQEIADKLRCSSTKIFRICKMPVPIAA